MSGESIVAPGPIVSSRIPAPKQLHEEIEDELIGMLLLILWRSNQNKFGTHPAVTGLAMTKLRELHQTLQEGDYTRQAFPTTDEALKAAQSRHQDFCGTCSSGRSQTPKTRLMRVRKRKRLRIEERLKKKTSTTTSTTELTIDSLRYEDR